MEMKQMHYLKPAASLPLSGAHSGFLRRKCACGGSLGMTEECEACPNKSLRRRATTETVPATVPPIVHEVLHSSGQPLDLATRRAMGSRFGHDFRNVRIHTGTRAAQSAGAVNALAYTVGRDVVFGAGQFAPGTEAGTKLLAHELAHAVQQAGDTSQASEALRIAPQHDSFEQQADTAAARAQDAGGTLTAVSTSLTAGLVQRAEGDTGVKTEESESDCSGWLQDPESISKRAAEHFAGTELPGDHGHVEKIECNPAYKLPDMNCMVYFSSGTKLKVLVTKDTIIVGATVGHQIIEPICWYDFKCPPPNRDLVLTKRKCRYPKPAGKTNGRGPQP